MKKLSIKAAIFVGFFVGSIVFIVNSLAYILFPSGNNLIISIIAGLTAFVGGMLVNKLFTKE